VRNALDNSFVAAGDVLYKGGHTIEGRFFLISVGHSGGYLVIEALEEISNKKLELRLKVRNVPKEGEIRKLVGRLGVRRIMDDDEDEVLVLN